MADQAAEVLNLLRLLMGSNEATRKPAEDRVRELEGVPGFQSCLLKVAVSDQPPDLRLLALILQKNAIDRTWRMSRAPGAVQPAERAQIKQALLSHFTEPQESIAKMLAVVVARIARFDWPRSWDELFPSLLQTIQTNHNNNLVLHRGLYTLSQVLKELSTKKIVMARRQFEEAAGQMIGYVRQMWMSRTENLVCMLQQSQASQLMSPQDLQAINDNAKLALLFIKCLQRLVVKGVAKPDEHPETLLLFPSLLQVLKALHPLLAGIQRGTELHKTISKIVLVMGQTALEAQKERPLHFGKAYLLPFMEYFHSLLNNSFDAAGHMAFERLSVQAITFFNKVVLCPAYQAKGGLTFSASGGLKFDHQAANEVKAQLAGVLTPHFIGGLARLLVVKFLVLRREDLEAWEDTPEEFFNEEQLVRAEEKVRPATEALLAALFQKHPDVMASVCMELLSHTLKHSPPAAQCPPPGSQAHQELLVKEAVYFAVGSGSYELNDAFKANNFRFENWYQQVLAQEIASTDPNLKLLRRRAIWVVGEWGSEVPDQLRPRVYADIVKCLGEGDLVVVMTAAGALRRLVEDIGFIQDVQSFGAVMQPTFELLFKAICAAQELETRSQVMHVVRQLTETLGERIMPAMTTIFKYLPMLWDNCADQNLLRSSILVTLTFLVKALKTESRQLHSFIIPVLQFCTTNPNQNDKMYLAEQALELWQVVLQMAPGGCPDLLALFPNWLEMTASSTENLETLIGILESYLLLHAQELMARHAAHIAQAVHSLWQRVRQEGLAMVASVLESFAQQFPQQFPAVFEQVLSLLLKDVVESKNSRDHSDVSLAAYLHVLARLFFQNWEAMVKALLSFSNGSSQLLCTLLDIWFEKFDCMSLAYRRKLSALAMCNMLQSNDPAVLQRLPGILACVTSVLSEEEADDAGDMVGQLDRSLAAVPMQQRVEEHRVQAMVQEDPATRINLRQYLVQNMQGCSARMGKPAFDELLRTVDPLLLAGL